MALSWGRPACVRISSHRLLPHASAMAPESEVAPLTLDDVRSIFVDVRSHYADKDDDVDLGQICRNMMVTRVADFCKRLSRCEVRPSDRHGEGLFVTRDVDAGELITFFPGDALLFWASGDRKGDLMVYFGAHVPQSERDASEIVSTRAREYELYISAELSAVGDPARRDDPACACPSVGSRSVCPACPPCPSTTPDGHRHVATSHGCRDSTTAVLSALSGCGPIACDEAAAPRPP